MRLRLLVTFSVLALATAGWAGSEEAWAKTLPSFRMLDPLERAYTEADLTERGAIVVVTAPTHAQGDAQKAWNAVLHQLEVDDQGPRLVMLEDMSQSWFRPMVIGAMKSSYRPNARVLVLLDEGGVTRKALGVPEARTLVFAFAPGGKVVAVETGEASLERGQKLLAAARRAP